MVSIVIPCYNSEKWIIDCLDSCLFQDYGIKDIEVIIVDDCSTDRTREIIDCSVHSGAVTVITNKENLGTAGTINVGIRASKGEYILILAADDMLTKNSISGRMKMFGERPELEIIYGFMLKIHGDISYGEAIAGQWKRHPSEFTTPIYRRSVFEKYGLLHPEMRSKEDKEYSYRLGIHRKSPLKRVVNIEKASFDVYYYRRHENAQRKRRAKDIYFYVRTMMAFDKRIMQLRRDGITRENTEFL